MLTKSALLRKTLQREREVWVEFVEGRRIDRVDAEVMAGLADLFAMLYRRDARLVPIESTPFARALHDDLEFLGQVGVVSDGVRMRFHRQAVQTVLDDPRSTEEAPQEATAS